MGSDSGRRLSTLWLSSLWDVLNRNNVPGDDAQRQELDSLLDEADTGELVEGKAPRVEALFSLLADRVNVAGSAEAREDAEFLRKAVKDFRTLAGFSATAAALEHSAARFAQPPEGEPGGRADDPTEGSARPEGDDRAQDGTLDPAPSQRDEGEGAAESGSPDRDPADGSGSFPFAAALGTAAGATSIFPSHELITRLTDAVHIVETALEPDEEGVGRSLIRFFEQCAAYEISRVSVQSNVKLFREAKFDEELLRRGVSEVEVGLIKTLFDDLMKLVATEDPPRPGPIPLASKRGLPPVYLTRPPGYAVQLPEPPVAGVSEITLGEYLRGRNFGDLFVESGRLLARSFDEGRVEKLNRLVLLIGEVQRMLIDSDLAVRQKDAGYTGVLGDLAGVLGTLLVGQQSVAKKPGGSEGGGGRRMGFLADKLEHGKGTPERPPATPGDLGGTEPLPPDPEGPLSPDDIGAGSDPAPSPDGDVGGGVDAMAGLDPLAGTGMDTVIGIGGGLMVGGGMPMGGLGIR